MRIARMPAYPGILPYRSGWKALQAADPAEAERQGMVFGKRNAVDLLREGQIHFRDLPRQQSLEVWGDFWSEYRNG